jgi:hypothetical protein
MRQETSAHRPRWRRNGLRGLLVAAVASTVLFGSQSIAHAEDAWISASNDYGYAGAGWNWSGGYGANNIDLVVSDWNCDSKPVYAYFRILHTDGSTSQTSTLRYDYSGCDSGDFSHWFPLSLSSNKRVFRLALVICGDYWPFDLCNQGSWSSVNPHA